MHRPPGLTYSVTTQPYGKPASPPTVFTIGVDGRAVLQSGASPVPFGQESARTGQVATSEQLSETPVGIPETGCGIAGCSTNTPTLVSNGIVLTGPGGTKHQLTSGGYDTFPVFSPDGRRLAYTSLRKAGQSTHSVTVVRDLASGDEADLVPPDRDSDFRPVWSPDGSSIAVIRGGGPPDRPPYGAIWVWRADATAPPRHLAGSNTAPLQSVSWAPDGHALAAAALLPGLLTAQVAVIDAASGAVRLITALQPDHAVFVQNCRGDGDASGTVDMPMWSPDSRSIAFTSTYENYRFFVSEPDIDLVDADGSDLRTVERNPTAGCFNYDHALTTFALLGWAG